MKTLVVSSALTFVPDNYEGLICPLAEHPHVQGLMLLENRTLLLAAQATALVMTGAAPRLGLQLLRNFNSESLQRKLKTYQNMGKQTSIFQDPNSPEALSWIRSGGFDLILNARTRFIFKRELLGIPRIGCINIHHGLLPKQRGLMCDLWSFFDNEPLGFSIHRMTPKLDDGEILAVVEVPRQGQDYLATIAAGAKLELETCRQVLDRIAESGRIEGRSNHSADIVYRRNPTLLDFYRLRQKGVRL
ncbi:MAG: formyltransferase family protein [Bdellovibrionaceae bacterium]|nr:formyltransferase family protein [Pseudobdellovibrionaceae bacterium]